MLAAATPLVPRSTRAPALLRSPERPQLVEAAASLRDVVRRHAPRAGKDRTLAAEVLGALRGPGFFRMAAPRDIGGLAVDPVTEAEVIEELAAADASTAWTAMIGISAVGSLATLCSQRAVKEIFGGQWPAAAGNATVTTQTARRVEGGYTFTGTWSFMSGVRHSDWVFFGARHSGTLTIGVAPTTCLSLTDERQVVGVAGTGSCSVTAQELFVPDHRIIPFPPASRRGGPRHTVMEFSLTPTIGLLAGAARHGLAAVREHVGAVRGAPQRPGDVSGRQHGQRALAELDIKLAAARAYAYQTLTEVWTAAHAGSPPSKDEHVRLMAVMTHLADVAAEITVTAMRLRGDDAAYLSDPLRRNARDVIVAAQHVVLSERNYESYGQMLIGRARDPGTDAGRSSAIRSVPGLEPVGPRP
ncbi:acyl-CoA dehydrogenase family protein [Kineosporia sp. J2-2]|uniref:Acyl-CoA dehydrogenase family protein n=1 Tax=Kineosporia corallincola TaxID=2835133 RepID=A0ABS5TFG4_9ACTN|nr:acyl-CoA dehydrogenase family protein [Kineosporia corallincola]MBT0769833.1 acyl-CoA dehydrogenase family protein [Kineosporia corallincola]